MHSNPDDVIFTSLQYVVPQALLSRLAGKLADATTPWLKNLLIRRFCATYNVDLNDAVIEDATGYESFNAFFTRALKPGARPVGEGIVSPADGTLSQSGAILHSTMVQAKGHSYTVEDLLGGQDQYSTPFKQGQFATVYLSPRDYHRVHMPCDGVLKRTVYIPGQLFSVNTTTAARVPNLFARNERLVCHFDTEYGPMAMVLVGAMIVAGIETVWSGQVPPHANTVQRSDFDASISLKKGEEMGRFNLGSTVILCFPDGVDTLPAHTAGSTLRQGQALMQKGLPDK